MTDLRQRLERKMRLHELIEIAESDAEAVELLKVIHALLDCVEKAQDASMQIKTQKSLWPAEVDDMDDAITVLEELCK